LTPTLAWSSIDATSYDVRFGSSNPPVQVATGQANASYTPPTLASSTTYFWQVVARNGGGTTDGPVWSFTTINAAPATPGSPVPANNAIDVLTTPTLTWNAPGATSYDVSFGTTSPPPAVSTGQAGASYTPATLAHATTYFWRVVAHGAGGTTAGPIWSFSTESAPTPPGIPGSPTPADAASNVALNTTLTWSSAGAATFDVNFGTTNPPTQVSAAQVGASYTPSSLASGTTYFWQIVAHNGGLVTTGPVWSFTTSTPPAVTNVVLYASDIPAGALHGSWTTSADPDSPNLIKLVTTDKNFSTFDNPLAAPEHFIDVSFNANAGTPFTIWLRLKALNNNKYNDSLWIQFSDAMVNGSAVYRLNSTSGLLVNLATDSAAGSLNGWGWKNNAYWLSQPTTVTFATSGTHTLRIQVREDGVQLDQIVLSPSTYLNAAPGTPTSDATIVAKP
jgi:hypothetical protein